MLFLPKVQIKRKQKTRNIDIYIESYGITSLNISNQMLTKKKLYLFYFSGSALPWRWAAAAGTIPALLSLVGAFFMSESAAWLLGRSRHADAERALVKLRGGGGPDVRAELEELVRAEELRARGQQSSGLRQISKNLRKPQFWKPLIIINVFFAFQQWSGELAKLFYLFLFFKFTKTTSFKNSD